MSWTVWVIIIERTLMLIQHFSVIKKVKFFGSLVFLSLILSACATPAGDAKDVKNKTSMNPGRELGLDQEQKSAAQASGQKNAHFALSSSAFANVRSALDGAQVNELSDKVSSSLTQTAINKTEDLINQKANEVVNSKGHGKTQVSLRQLETKNPQFSIKTIQPLSDLTDTSTQLTFTQAQISSGENHGERRATINLGIGQRYLLEDGQAVAGINLFTDYETESKHSRASLGLEYQRANFSANANKYHPLSSKVVIGDYTEEPLAGYDIRLTGQMPYLPWARIKGTQYYWDATAGEDIKGIRLGIEADINASTTFEIGTENSNTANRSAYAALRVQLPYRANPTSGRLKVAGKAFEDSSGVSLTDLNYVERSNKIRVEKLLNGVSVVLGDFNAATVGATCTLFNAAGTPIANASGLTGPDGLVSLSNVVLPSGLVYSECTGGAYTDEATGDSVVAPKIRSAIIYSGTGGVTMVATPLSEIAYQMADTNAGTALASTITAKNAEVAAAFGLGSINITSTIPANINTTIAANDDAGRFATILAAISQMGENSGDDNPTDTITALLADIQGSDGSGVGTIEGRNSGTEVVDIATAIHNFVTNSGDNNTANGATSGNIDSSVGEGSFRGDLAIAIIKAYDGTGTAPTLRHYTDAGVTGVTADNLAAVNSAVANKTAGTTAQIQALVDANNTTASNAIVAIDAYTGTDTAPTLQQYVDAGVTGVTEDNIAAVNAAVANKTAGTTAQIQALADTTIAALNLISAYTGANAIPTLQNYLDAGVTGVTSGNLDQINDRVATKTTAETDTTVEIQSVINIPVAVTFTIGAIANVDVAEAVAFTGVTPFTSGETPIGTLTYTLSGADKDDFTINSTTGVIAMVARNREKPVDANEDNAYAVTMIATDSMSNTAEVNQIVTVTDVAIESEVVIGTQTWTGHNMSNTPTANNIVDVDYWTAYGVSDGSGSAEDEDGYYYTHDAAINVCPSGWSLPSLNDYAILAEYVVPGASGVDWANTGGWVGTSEGAALFRGGSSGFDAYPAGYRHSVSDPSFLGRGDYSRFWISDTNNSSAMIFVVPSSTPKIIRQYQSKMLGLSVRCLKD